jgi:DNA-binding CsgD family transcriptional regulator
MSEAGSTLERAQAHLAAGAWRDAKATFRAALEEGSSPEGLFGLGVAAWWLGDTRAALSSWQDAYRAAAERDEPERAVLSAVYLCLGYEMSLGNEAVATGWADLADELVTRRGLVGLDGWVLLCRAHLANDHGRPSVAEAFARDAVERARRSGDVDLELCATGELGTSLVGTGRSEEGLSLLGRAMARALAGEASDPDAVVLIGCRIVTSCSRASDVNRALQWVHATDGFNDRYGSPHLFTTCRAHYGAVLVTTGAWDDAERELLAALEIGKLAEPALYAEAAAKLAELRLGQGRLDEAERLLAGLEAEPRAMPTIAALDLARGDPSAASSLIERRLRRVDDDCLEAMELTELLARADIARGAFADAAARARALLERAEGLACAPIVARASRVLGHALLDDADPTPVRDHLERALAIFDDRGMVVDAARTRVLLGRLIAATDTGAAVAELRSAMHTFETIGASRDADEAASWIRSLGARAPRGGPSPYGALTRREREVMRLLTHGLGNPEIADRLFITRKTVEHHVGSILAKLGLRTRAEVAAYVARHAPEELAKR